MSRVLSEVARSKPSCQFLLDTKFPTKHLTFEDCGPNIGCHGQGFYIRCMNKNCNYTVALSLNDSHSKIICHGSREIHVAENEIKKYKII